MGGSRLRRFGLTAAMALTALNIWTGSPLVALWVGSKLQGPGPPKLTSVVAVTITMTAISFVLVRILAILGRSHDRLTGHTPPVAARDAWLQSSGGERSLYPGERPQVTALEGVLIAMVVLAIVAFEAWFFLLSGSPLDASGR